MKKKDTDWKTTWTAENPGEPAGDTPEERKRNQERGQFLLDKLLDRPMRDSTISHEEMQQIFDEMERRWPEGDQ
jgi:hypothetical protein